MRTTGKLAEFHTLVAKANALQADAERLCNEANESGEENEEFEVREEAAEMRAAALDVAVDLLRPDVPVMRVLDLCTSHLPKVICERLSGYDGVIAHNTPAGWLLWVPNELEQHLKDYGVKSIPRPVRLIWEYAANLGCSYVLLDRDAETVEELRTWDW